MIRTQKRSQVRADADTTTPSATNKSRSKQKESVRKTSPFLEAIKNLTDTSNDDTKPDTNQDESPNLLLNQVPNVMDVQTKPNDDDEDAKSIRSDITQQAADLEQNMINAMKDLEDPDTKDELNIDILTPLVSKTLKTELQSVIKSLQIQDSIMQAHTDHCRQQSNDLEHLINDTKKLQTKMRKQIDTVELKLNYVQRKADEYTHMLNEMKMSYRKFIQELDSKTDNINQNTPQSTVQEDTLKQMSEKFKRCLTRLKNTTTKLFEQQENNNDLVHDRIIQIEDTLKEIQTSSSSQNKTCPKRLFSDDSTSDDTPIPKQPDKPKSTSYFYSPQSNI